MDALNLDSVEAYQSWCMQNGFSSNLHKTATQLRRELDKHRDVSATLSLKKHSREGKLRYQIEKLFRKESDCNKIKSDVLQEVFVGFQKSKYAKSMRDTLLYFEAKTKFFRDARYVRAIVGLALHRVSWMRPLAQWAPSSHNVERQFSSLARYLFAKYDVPEFMNSAWYQGNRRHQEWFIHIGKGNNIRTARSLPVTMTKKMAHHFMQAPSDYTVNAALRWAQIKALGGNHVLVNAINETRLSRNFKDEEFWLGVFRFFIDNPMLDYQYVNPIVDYIWNQKYENRAEFVGRGVVRDIGPAQPNFTMRGRTPESLLRQVDEWHRQLGREARGGNFQWKKSGIGEYKFVEGNRNSGNMKIWTIRELLSSKELIAEGRQQGHCVASYARSCYRGMSSIYTMDVRNKFELTKTVTVEVNIQHREVCQVRGKRNRPASATEMAVIRRWALKEDLKITNYI